MGALDGQASGAGAPAGSSPPAPPKMLTLATCACWGAVDPEGQVEDGPQMVLELRRHRALDGPVPRVVGPGGDLVDHQDPSGPEELHREHARRPRRSPPPPARGRGPARPRRGAGGPARGPRGTPRPTWAVSVAGQVTVSPEGRRATMTANSASNGTISSTSNRPAKGAITAAASAGSSTDPHPLAVVAAPGRLEHDRPSVVGGELPRSRRAARRRRPARPGRAPRWAGTGMPAATSTAPHVGLVHRHLQRLQARAG